MKGKLKNLFEQANSSEEQDTSINGAGRDFPTEQEAQEFFLKLDRKLFQIPAWNTNSALSSYAQFDENGREIDGRPLSEGDFIRISLKGAGKYDWVKIDEIYRTPDETVITVKPTFDPTEETPDRNATSHFFTSDATNNFCLQRDEKAVLFYVIGLQEKTNLRETGGILATARNAAVANFGSYLGIQSGEWKTFCRNFLEITDEVSESP